MATWNFGRYLGNNKFPEALLSNNEDDDLIFAVQCHWSLSCFPERDENGRIRSYFTLGNSTIVSVTSQNLPPSTKILITIIFFHYEILNPVYNEQFLLHAVSCVVKFRRNFYRPHPKDEGR